MSNTHGSNKSTRLCVACGIFQPPAKTRICRPCREKVFQAYEHERCGQARAELELFALEFAWCWNCRWPLGDRGGVIYEPGDPRQVSATGLHIHHILGGPCRKHIRANLARLCNYCHAEVHANKISLEHVLWLKRKYDPAGYSRRELQQLLGKKLLPRAKRDASQTAWLGWD